MKVYLIRHAQSEENVLDMKVRSTIQDFNELVRRSHESPLTREGEIQTRIVVEKLTGARIERLYSSPFVRTLSTATAIGEALDLTPQLLDDLREVLPRPMSERRREAPLKRLFVRGYVEMLWPWGGGETWMESYRRAKAVWHEITREPACEIAVVSHRGLISLILLYLTWHRDWRVITSDISNGGVSIITRRKP
jgi:broad specificity phosphatase PhoE